MEHFLRYIEGLIWGFPLVLLLIFVGLYFTFTLRGLQFTKFFFAIRQIFYKPKNALGNISPFRSYMLASAATIGRINIVGVAIAMVIGGEGALFWMWVIALISMSTKYAEAVLGVKYRVKSSRGLFSGGPMYYIEHAIGWKSLAVVFAIFGILASFGIGNILQINSFADVMSVDAGMQKWLIGLLMAIITMLVMIGGVKRIALVASFIVPLMLIAYVLFSVVILSINYNHLPNAFVLIFKGAFVGKAALGGFLGAIVGVAFRSTGAKALFSSEAGLGTAGITAAMAKTDHPCRQALIAMTDVFVDTIIISTMTGLVMIVTGVLEAYKNVQKMDQLFLPFDAFSSSFPVFGGIIAVLIFLLFVYSSILGWYFHGEKCFTYLFGGKSVHLYQFFFIFLLIWGASSNSYVVQSLSYISSGMMALINLISLIVLSKIVKKETADFFKHKL